MNVKDIVVLYGPVIAAGLILLGLVAWIGYVAYSSRNRTGFVIKDEYVEAFVYVVLLGLVLWILKASGFWSTALIKEMYQ